MDIVLSPLLRLIEDEARGKVKSPCPAIRKNILFLIVDMWMKMSYIRAR